VKAIDSFRDDLPLPKRPHASKCRLAVVTGYSHYNFITSPEVPQIIGTFLADPLTNAGRRSSRFAGRAGAEADAVDSISVFGLTAATSAGRPGRQVSRTSHRAPAE